MFLIVIPITLVTLLYIWMKWKYSFWQHHKVLGPKPSFFVGNIGQTFTFSEHWGIIAENWYKAYSNEPYIGYYKMLQPAIVACDPDLVKDIMITKFNSFRDNDSRISEKFDPLLKANPFFNSDEEWKELRKQLSPMFSPSKLKNVMPVMNEVGEEFANFIKSQLKNNEFNAKDLCMRFTTQNLAKCAFSIDPGCFGDGQDSEFVTMLKELFEPSFLVGLKFLAWPIMPKWALDLIPLPFVPKSTDHFLRDMTRTNKTSRTNNVKSHDFFQLLLELQSKYNFTDGMLTGHVLSLFTEGTETSNTTMSYVLYELAKHPDCQEKLFDDITTILNKYDGKLSFEALQEITYLECVVLETLRIDSPVLTLQKVCTEYFTLPKNNKQTKPVTIAPGTVVTIPVQAIHMDPKNYPNPEVFDPERFTEEEQRNRHKGIFLSFGEGPRICPGMRFGIAQSKLAILYIVKNFRIKLSPNHKPIVIDPQTLMSYPKDGILIQFEAR